MKPHGFHRETLDEYAQAAEDYAKINPELGGRFYDEIERLIGDACRSFCGAFPSIPRLGL